MLTIAFHLYPYRLTIVYAFILGFIATLLVYLGSGPFWFIVGYMKMGCRYSWWNNLLYVNNYVHSYPRDVNKIVFILVFQ